MEANYTAVAEMCEKHADRLEWAKTQLAPHFPLQPAKLASLDNVTVAVLDQFSTRFSKLQDAMGAKLFPAVLELTKEQGELSTFIDRLNRLEKIGALPSVDDWLILREMRNQFAHDYPDDPEIQAAILNRAMSLSDLLLETLSHIKHFAVRYDRR